MSNDLLVYNVEMSNDLLVCCMHYQATARGEEGMTLFFVCCNPNCGTRWREWDLIAHHIIGYDGYMLYLSELMPTSFLFDSGFG